MKRVKIILNSFHLQNLQHSVQNNYIYISCAKKLKEALKSLHDEYLEENLFIEANNSDAEDACSVHKKQVISRFILSTFLLWSTETTKYELFFILFSRTFQISNQTLTQI